MRSIRGRLLLGLLGGMLIAQMLVYGIVYARIEDEIDDLFDDELERSAISLAAGQPLLPLTLRRPEVENPRKGMVFAVWDHGQLQSTSLAPSVGVLPGEAPPRFSKVNIHGQRWHLFAVRSGSRFIVAGQPDDVRHVAARRICLELILPALAVVPLAGFMILLAVFYGLRPLERIRSDLGSRSQRDLSPIAAGRWPHEIAPLVRVLNELMLRMADLLAAQRKFIADAAHGLLTPLTALRLQAQLLARAETPERRREVLAELQSAISRAQQLARQLLTLARHGADAAELHVADIDLAVIVHQVVAIHQPVADAKSLQLEVFATEPCGVAGSEEGLCTMISSLIENAIKYTDQGRVRVSLERTAGGPLLAIEDSGPGIPLEERERVFDRFYRRPGQEEGGSGLGLSIAQEIANRHGGSITLQSSAALGGLDVRVAFKGTTGAVQRKLPLPRVA